MCSETSPLRLSFSHDLSELELLSFKHDESNSEFQFSSSSSSTLGFESSSADELFSNGVILPVKTLERSTSRRQTRHGESPYAKLPPRSCSQSVNRMKNLELSSDSERKSQSKSFWGFSRSRSMNSDTITRKSVFSPLPPLSRSSSIGSVPNQKDITSKDVHKHIYNRPPSTSTSSSSLSSSLNLYRLQKSGSGKNYGGSYGNGLRISPVLHVPTPCISKGTSNLFGLGSFLRVGKVKKTKH